MIFLSFFLFLNFGCDTAILSLTEQFKEELDNHKVISLVSMDLSKAFDTLPHDLIVKKLKDYGGNFIYQSRYELFKLSLIHI